MIARALSDGFRAATRRPALVALLWAWHLLLALVATLPFWAWVWGASGLAPETDVMLDGLDLGVLVHLLANNAAAVPAVFAAAAAVVLLSLLSGAFVSGGVLVVVLNRGAGEPLLRRFFSGAGHYFGRFVRLLVIAGITTAVVVALVSAMLTAAAGPLTETGSEPASLWTFLLVQAGAALALGFFLLALDYARALTVLTETRGMLRAWLRGLGFVLRHLPGATLIGVLAAIGVLATIALALWHDIAYSARTWGVIVGAIVLHQVLLFLRTAIRVGQVAAQAAYCEGLLPAAPVAVRGVEAGEGETRAALAEERADPRRDEAVAGSDPAAKTE